MMTEPSSPALIAIWRAAIALFESLGSKVEALLRDHVRDVDGKKHDLVVLAASERIGH